ncbi:hypothetical protein ACFQZS_12345 [Mucilaginibacter calamicampi]|uniref:MG2 domain-containing protein n=1 Tax=Mucilaginibacter calamicampi TaxID=1302352 RepID=A0ABW2YXT8_9SPHI
MNRSVFFSVLFMAIAGLHGQHTYAQQSPGVKLRSLSSALNDLREKKPVEKLYLQTDKPYYNAGDTLRFKGYLLNADYFTPSTNSGLLYVELDNELGKNVKRIMVPVENGLTWGDIALDSADVPNGTYTLRAYTNWMRNFGNDYIFEKIITVLQPSNNPLLAKANFIQAGNKVEGRLQFSFLDGGTFSFKDLEIKVMRGKRNLSKNKIITGPDGGVGFNFTVPEGEDALLIRAATATNGVLSIPVTVNRKENTDLQFMPEGGHLVAGLSCKVGFKAIGEDGKGVAVSGNIVDSKGNQVINFKSAHAGMGSISFTPAPGEKYTAIIDGVNKPYVLPAVKPAGTTLAVKNAGADSLQFIINSTPGIKHPFYLIAHARGVVCYAQTISSVNVKASVAKRLFPTGIVRFSLLNDAGEPVNERLAFIDHHDDLHISVTPHLPAYGIRDSIGLNITVTDKDNKPATGSFSIAVTDAGQVKPDSLGSNILNNMLFTSDLKGIVEEPGYYFAGNNDTDLDNLLLTQGWVGYDWKEAIAPASSFEYQPEKEFIVSGTVVSAFGKPIEKSSIFLASNRPIIVRDTITGKDGRFVFKGLFPVDTAIFKLQARNKNNREFNVAIKVDENVAPAFNKALPVKPWYVDTDSILLNNSRSKVIESIALSGLGGNMLKEVNIRSKKTIKDSKNLNGPGEADYIIDEDELKQKPSKTTLEEMLIEKFPNFKPIGGLWGGRILGGGFFTRPLPYLIGTKKIRLIFDGIPLDRLHPTPELGGKDRYNIIRSVLNYFTAEDVSGIEIMESTKYLNAYHGSIEGGSYEYLNISADSYVYIEITTRTKQGPWMKVTPGTYLHRPVPFTLPKQFYSPKYTAKTKTTAIGTDLRSTIFWEPNVITDKDGKAKLSFYSADKAANYTVIVEGANLDGALGFGKQQIKIK